MLSQCPELLQYFTMMKEHMKRMSLCSAMETKITVIPDHIHQKALAVVNFAAIAAQMNCFSPQLDLCKNFLACIL
jgi:hypothetical protein